MENSCTLSNLMMCSPYEVFPIGLFIVWSLFLVLVTFYITKGWRL